MAIRKASPVLTDVITTNFGVGYVFLLDGPMRLSMVSVPMPLASARRKTGPVALIAAMLDRALEDVRAGDRLRTEALAWVRDQGARERLGSFEWCCAALNLDVDAVRARITQQQSVSSDSG